ncbi:MAG: hypothetical protein IJH84_02560 [Saccharopolyspora sp.]|uniref:hypothetical protein n=1 Tax=Saccharopolyspora sp. TaxID=33915 RepID=UPI0025CE0472|nr:hypothetical protein [Saccharopolyspora sp.]MBQ6639899.1 hypothetical protein [Saccharopolyspora sp.]
MPRDNTDDDVVEHLFDVRLGGRSPGHLSWNTPFANMPLRYATADIDLGAVTIPSGAAILAGIGGAPACCGRLDTCKPSPKQWLLLRLRSTSRHSTPGG